MRWISAAVAAATVGVVAWLGFSPTSVGVSNSVGPLECAALFAPIEGASLIENLSDQQKRVAAEWLVSLRYIDEGATPTAEQEAQVVANVRSLCSEAQQTRSAWVTVTAVFGSALALAALPRRRETNANTNREVARG